MSWLGPFPKGSARGVTGVLGMRAGIVGIGNVPEDGIMYMGEDDDVDMDEGVTFDMEGMPPAPETPMMRNAIRGSEQAWAWGV